MAKAKTLFEEKGNDFVHPNGDPVMYLNPYIQMADGTERALSSDNARVTIAFREKRNAIQEAMYQAALDGKEEFTIKVKVHIPNEEPEDLSSLKFV